MQTDKCNSTESPSPKILLLGLHGCVVQHCWPCKPDCFYCTIKKHINQERCIASANPEKASDGLGLWKFAIKEISVKALSRISLKIIRVTFQSSPWKTSWVVVAVCMCICVWSLLLWVKICGTLPGFLVYSNTSSFPPQITFFSLCCYLNCYIWFSP